MKLRVFVIVAVLIGVIALSTPAHANHFEWPDDNTTDPVIDETTAFGPLARTLRLSVPEGGGFELSVAAHVPPGSPARLSQQANLRKADGSGWQYHGLTGFNEGHHVRVHVEGQEPVDHRTFAEIPADSALALITWNVASNLSAGNYLVEMWTASDQEVGWSRLRVRASAGVSIVSSTSSTETFYAACPDFDGTHVNAGNMGTGASAAVDAAYTVAVDNGLVAKYIVDGSNNGGKVLGTDVYQTRSGYVSPDGVDHQGLRHDVVSAATGDYTFYVDHTVAKWWECAYLSGADIAPA